MYEGLEPIPFYTPIIVAFCVYLGCAIFYLVGLRIYQQIQKARKHESNSSFEDDPLLPQQPKRKSQVIKPDENERVSSLDAWRGMSLGIMIFGNRSKFPFFLNQQSNVLLVNYGGGGYWFFSHSAWNGLTVADLVFPWFIWIMGTSMALSFRKVESQPKLSVLYKIVRRSVILLALGLFMNNGYYFQWWRFPGVL